MSKIKKCLLIIVISIMSLIVFQGKSKGYTVADLINNPIGVTGNIGVGSTITLNPGRDLLGRNDVYCVQHSKTLNSKDYSYWVKKYVMIEGNYAKWYGSGVDSSNPKWNPIYGTVAYILEKGKQGYGSSYGNYTSTQLAIYNKIGGLDADFNIDETNVNVPLDGTAQQLISGAEAYSNVPYYEYDDLGFNATPYIKDNTNKSKVEVYPFEKDGTEYIRVGPFNWEINGVITEMSVKSDNGSIPGVSYSKFVGDKEVYIDNNEIVSSENFYITIKANEKHTNIKTIDATVVKKSQEYVKAEIWLLQHDSVQNLMLARSTTVPFQKAELPVTLDYNIKLTRSIKVVKVDDRNEKIALSGVGFVLKNLEMNKYVRVQNGEVSYIELSELDENNLIEFLNNGTINKNRKPTEFVTDKNGKLPINKYKLLVGTYEAIETLNPNYGYVLDEQERTIIPSDYDDTMTITNHQRYVKLSGFIWKDIQSGKSTVRNDLYKTSTSEYTDDKDEAFNGITVRLKRRSGQTVTKEDGTEQVCVSAEKGLYSEINGGEYIFEEIEIEDLSLYYVEFEYDGLIYQSVALPKASDLGKNNVSKATDVRERKILDKNFAKVDATGENRVNVNNGTYSITYNDTVNHTTSIKDSSDCILHARTDDAKLDISNYFKPAMEEIRYINLGLYEKLQADLSLTQDLKNVNIGVNGYWHVYNYGKRTYDESAFKIDDDETWNVGVKYKNSFTGTYKRAIYQSDYNYTNEDTSKELQVYLTYKIAITNESSYLTRANSIVDYFDNRFKLIGVGTGLDGENNITGDLNYRPVESNNSKYQKYIIDVNSIVESGKSKDIYIQFKLDRTATIEIINGREVLYNRAEITSYTVFKDDGRNTVAAIDKDSVPGNTNIDDINTYEDDTDSAPPVQLEIADNARQIQGTVFVDSTTGELKTGEIRQGNGIFDDGELEVEGVQVRLHELNNSIEDMIVTTDSNGNFRFEGYIPGQYTITYTWGDKTYTVQNYKGTIYDLSRNQDMYWYKDQVDTRKTDAIDDYNTRIEIDKNTSEITDSTIYEEIRKAYDEQDSKIKYTKMDSITPAMEFSVEYDTNVTDGMIDKMEFIVKNVDFGIVERARQQLDMTKRVSSFKITLANGQILVDATVDENGNLQGSHDYVTYMGPITTNDYSFDGYIKAEMDSELIEGAILEIGYEIKFVNNSEVDYMSEKYYKYGNIEGQKVTLTPSAVVDYLDKDLGFEVDKNSDWNQITVGELENLNAVKVGDTDFLNSRTILYTESTAVPLQPTMEKAVNLNVSKLLTTSNDLTFDNDAETVEIEKTVPTPTPTPTPTGSIIKFFPVDTSEQAQVTPSTGGDKAYVVPTIIGITSLLILSVGICIIKKTVIDNK